MPEVINGIRINSSHIRVRDLIKKWSHTAGFCWASNVTIAEKLKLSKSYVSHIITDLNRAGMIGRKICFSQEKTFESRRLMAFKEVVTMEVANKKVDEKIKDNIEKAEQRRLVENGKRVGIAPAGVMRAIKQFGRDKVDEALAIVRASNSVTSPYAYFCSALKKGWKAGKKATKLMQKEFVGGIKVASQDREKEETARAKIKAGIEKAEARKVNNNEKPIVNDFLRQFLKGNARKTGTVKAY